ncbi:nitronate monooxygenase family protein [Thioalkalivibrio sp. XN279]|uniref:NAD(P)H-dependent flavin oxidoreductase n=1 Tax=Thioalkalivibrio sp. XN279 TaxID=2714953 RepID=UPI00197E78B1
MALPESFRSRIAVPAVAAPMFLVSGPELIIETCKGGIPAAFPALNRRSTAEFVEWLDEVGGALDETHAPWGVNLIVHRSNPRLEADLAACVEHKVPFIVTSLGAVPDLVKAVHGYGGVVFHDVISIRHAHKAAEAGVDGLIAVCAGAGGHSGATSPFALTSEIRQFFDGTLLLAGAINEGHQVAAALVMGADLAWMGSRFIATRESLAPEAYKQMMLRAAAKDIVYTDAVSGVPANFLRESLEANDFDVVELLKRGLGSGKLKDLGDEAKAWKTIWSAGQGVGGVQDVPSAAELCARLKSEFDAACAAGVPWPERG